MRIDARGRRKKKADSLIPGSPPIPLHAAGFGRTSRHSFPSPRSAGGERKGGKHAGGAGFAAPAPFSTLTAIAQPIQLEESS